MLTDAQIAEVERLASLWATARCRRTAVHLGRPGRNETKHNTTKRCKSAYGNLHGYLINLQKETPCSS